MTMMIGRLDDWIQVLVKATASSSTRAIRTGPGSRASRRRTRSSVSAAIAPGPSPPHTGTCCTGRSSWAATSFFRCAYDVDGLSVDEFDNFGPTVRTLRGFVASYDELVATVRDYMLPNPDIT